MELSISKGFSLITPKIGGRKIPFVFGLIFGLWLLTPILRSWLLFGLIGALLLVLLALFFYSIKRYGYSLTLCNFQSKFQKIRVCDLKMIPGQPDKRLLLSNESEQNAIYLNSPELAVDYDRYYRLVDLFLDSLETALCLGGGAYSVPKDIVRVYSQSKVDVVEIDPQVTQVAEKYFNTKHERIITLNQDAHQFLEDNPQKQYDLIFLDVFIGKEAPFSLMTKEAAELLRDHLNNPGVLIVNLGGTTGKGLTKSLRAKTRAYQQVFSQIYLFLAKPAEEKEKRNVILMVTSQDRSYSKSELKNLAKKSGSKELLELIDTLYV